MGDFFRYWFQDVDDLLRGERTLPRMLSERGLDIRPGRLVVVIIAMSMAYGLCMGSFALMKDVPPELANRSGRYLQVFASMVKTPALFFLTLLVTLPSLYVFNALVGSRLRPAALVNLLVASLAINTTVLASLGPIVAFFSVSTNSHPFIVLLNVAMFTVAGVLGLMFLLQTLHRLTGVDEPQPPPVAAAEAPVAAATTASDARLAEPSLEVKTARPPSPLDMPAGETLARQTRIVFRAWVVLFALVGAQMGWVLRPFIGSPDLPFRWFRERDASFFAGVMSALGKLLLGE